MRVAYFTHSLASCWNHGNAHFLRGVLRDLGRRGHEVTAHEPDGAWSLSNLLADHGDEGLTSFRQTYGDLDWRGYPTTESALEAAASADLVIVHEWSDPALVAALGKRRRRGGRFSLLFHDTHHRAVSDADAIKAFDLDGYDGVLAFGETLAAVYRGWGWGDRVFVWHEAADTTVFQPPAIETPREGLIWIGNWGDGERTAEIEDYLLAPARDAALGLDVHGVRYPAAAKALLARYGANYRGWLPNAWAPSAFARNLATIHVPRRFYVEALPGIPTIRVFEALACGIPLVSAPWQDAEGLFRPGEDYLVGQNRAAMTAHLRALAHDPDLRASLAARGLETIRARHTCAHRVDELLSILARIGAPLESVA